MFDMCLKEPNSPSIQTGYSPACEPSIFRKILDGMFSIIVVPSNTVMIQKRE
jgi:hypothetical protein